LVVSPCTQETYGFCRFRVILIESELITRYLMRNFGLFAPHQRREL